MTKKKIDIRDYAGDIIKAMRPGILLTTKVGNKVNSMTIGWGTLGVISTQRRHRTLHHCIGSRRMPC